MKALFRFLAASLIKLLMASAAVPGEVDRHCWKSPLPDSKEEICQILAVDEGRVTFIEPGVRSLVIGKYVGAAQRFVPRTEAPIRDVRSPQGWHVVVSLFLAREEESAKLRIRFFGPDG
jgi:hypothetical protein